MTRNHLCCSTLVLLTVFGCGGAAAVQCRWGEGCVCVQCPPGQQPSKACAEIQSPAEEVSCQSCPVGTFSDALDSELCRPHLSCELIGRSVATPGTVASDAQCGDCLPGLFSTEGSNQSPCVEKTMHSRPVRTVAKGTSAGTGGPVNGTVVRSAEEKTAEYAVFALVPIFCVMGLLGILICNILKKKGYNCMAEKEGADPEMASPQKDANNCPYISDDILNEDTISVLVRLITEKKENAAALEELLLEYESKQTSKASSIKLPMMSPLSTFRSLPRLCPHQSHLHTISGMSGLAPRHGYRCTRCAQRKWPPVLIPPLDALKDPLKAPQSLTLPSLNVSMDQQKSPLLAEVCVDAPHHTLPGVPNTIQDKTDGAQVKERKEGELTVVSVGRFQVAQIPEHKPVIREPKTSTQEQRHSFFGMSPFSSSSVIRR
ncbi:tumor necrosis factor receptor superfamily member 19L [Periophthalmus magnuspinnatus]|uniref:tumor necrosis factor receptor superfamily member 19L n=1 Tax=Periophthalmus magnuspinnatus TaxID=409849 RepID=UPI00145B5B24|nr:tumor necrosis factor receptor superfamily member 19L [Periophthalmus magnuspinnatus]XP_055081931.1 tumor necrosis factor receptor superfamily member 19L [Periophthalmus magnuspinnatus]